jgi:hypothetical protein
MARKRSTPPRQLSHRWYLAEWAKMYDKSQADAQRALGWSKASASTLFRNKQRYTQDLIDEAADWLQVRPYELLLPPDVAMAIRRVREDAARIVSHTVSEEPVQTLPARKPRTAARG